MPIYDYKCEEGCHVETREYGKEGSPCPEHPVRTLRRIYGFRIAAPFQAHFSQATGQWVNNKRELFDQGQRGAEDINNRLGLNTNYQIVDNHDIAGLGVTPEVIPQIAERYGTATANKMAKEYQIST